jgi:TolB-like protein/tetratricopeptide (TPR) repeat protein
MLTQVGDILTPANQERSRTTMVAVLPFHNLSTDPTSSHICTGLTLDLITDLSRFKSFNIISHHTSELLMPDEDIYGARVTQLNADFIIKGTFRQANERVGINTQLIQTSTGKLIWAENFDGKVSDIFDIQHNILLQVANSLQQQLNHAIITEYTRRKGEDIDAYTCWLLGIEELRKGSFEADLEARNHFRKALEIHPEYSRAYTGLSLSYFNEWSCQIWDRWEVSQKGAYKYARKAFELDQHDYVAAMVLGRVYLYNAEYDTAEYYLRKSLQLNPNDTDNLVQVASCLTFLGYSEEAMALFEKAVHLNPGFNDNYREHGAFIYFELGEFTKCLSMAKLSPRNHGWVDMPAYIAAAWYMLGDLEKSGHYWNIFMDGYIRRINKGEPATNKQAVEWMMRVNPFKNTSQISNFWKHMRTGDVPDESLPDVPQQQLFPRKNVFTIEDGLCKIVYDGKQVVLPLTKGLGDIARMIQAPDQQFHCSDLMGSLVAESGVEVIDEKARKKYQEKIIQLQEELAYAEETNNSFRLTALQTEYDSLLDHLGRAMGMGGKTRKAQNTVDKIRSAVTWRIRSSIKKIQQVHPALAKHLDVSVSTGIFCTYSPEKPINWET